MGRIQSVSNFLSTGLDPDFTAVSWLEVSSQPLGSGAFGEVYACASINGTVPRTSQIVKILIDDGRGMNAKGFDTIQKLQRKIISESSARPEFGKSIAAIPALHALPQFSFRGEFNGRRIFGYCAVRLDTLGYKELDAILEEPNLTRQYHTLGLGGKLLLAYQLAEGVEILQRLSFIHADINPKNIFINFAKRRIALIDYDSGAVTSHYGDRPTTFGKPCDGEWQAFEIKRVLKRQLGPQNVKVDFVTDLWSVAVGVHSLVFLGAPLFFLAEISENSLSDYFRRCALEWPTISNKCRYLRSGVQAQHAAYVKLLQRPEFAPVFARLRHSINKGLLDPSVRTSCRQWMHTIEPCLGDSEMAAIRGVVKQQNPPKAAPAHQPAQVKTQRTPPGAAAQPHTATVPAGQTTAHTSKVPWWKLIVGIALIYIAVLFLGSLLTAHDGANATVQQPTPHLEKSTPSPEPSPSSNTQFTPEPVLPVPPSPTPDTFDAYGYILRQAALETPTPIPTLAPERYRVAGVSAGDYLNMRAGPSVNHPIVHRLGNGVDGLIVIEGPILNGDTSWKKINCQGFIGWVNADFLYQYDSGQAHIPATRIPANQEHIIRREENRMNSTPNHHNSMPPHAEPGNSLRERTRALDNL